MEQTLRIAPVRRRIIVNADDLGVSASRDAGIFECFRAGAISSASLLVDGIDAEAAVREATALDLPLGLHLNLTEGVRAAGTLTGPDGQLRGKQGLRDALAANAIDTADIAAEIRRQFERFIALTGELPSHVDGHHHIHVEARIAAVLAPIMAKEYGIYCVRLPRERGLDSMAADAEFEARFQRRVTAAADLAEAVFSGEGIYGTEAFLGQSLMGRRLSAAALGARLDEIGEATVELMVHPGIASGAQSHGAFCRDAGRDHERTVLQSAAWRHALNGWALTSFRDLPRREHDGRPTLLIYGKLTPATGNAETARRMAEAWHDRANVRFRPLLPDSGNEAQRLQSLAAREGLDLAVGIHVLRAGAPLAAAFGPGSSMPPLPYGLFASGTDANADAANPAHRPAMADALSNAEFLLCLTSELCEKLAGFTLPEDTGVLPNGIDVATDSQYSLRAEPGLKAAETLVFLPASLRRLKGVLPTIEALAPLLAGRFGGHALIVLGPVLEADYAAEVAARIAAFVGAHPALDGRIVLHPGLPHRDYLAALREAALVLNASDHEGQSHALMEAMAAGIPVLARDISANRNLVQEGVTGRLFVDFETLPEAYAACFDDPAATARQAEAARLAVATRYPASAERSTLQATLDRALGRRQVRLGKLRLDLAPGTHPVSPENLDLFTRIALPDDFRQQIGLAADVGCGCGVFGLAALIAAARRGTTCDEILFSDPHQASLAALARTLIRHAPDLPLTGGATLSDASLLDALQARPARAQLICANLPQTPGPAGFRLDRWGGSDGAELICRFLDALPEVLAEDGVAFLLHISLAHPARVRRTLKRQGLTADLVAEQTRHARFADYEAMQAGLGDYLRAERAAGRAEISAGDDDFAFRVQLLRLRHRTQTDTTRRGA